MKVAGFAIVVALASCASTSPDEATSTAVASVDLTFAVHIRTTGSSTIHAHVYTNPRGRAGIDVLALHGFTTTGFTFAPLADAVFDDPDLGRRVHRVIAIDLPGHGASDFPTGVRFGDLDVDDNVDMMLQSLDALRARGIAPRVIVGHSAGGLELQAMQERLLASGSSLAREGVFGAVLLAPVPPHGQPWQTGTGGGDPTQFIVNDPELGTYFLLTPEAWLPGLFGTLSAGTIVDGAPTPAEVVAQHYLAPEPIAAVVQLAEAPDPVTGAIVPRPSVRAGAFAVRRGTPLALVAFAEDASVHAADLTNLYEYLTGDDHEAFDRVIATPDAVHCMYVSNPSGMLDALRPML